MALTRNVRTPFGEFTRVDDEDVYRISAFDSMPPFLVNVASDSDLWMFISSLGGLAAGRVDADGSLFPYETVDKLHDAHLHTGPITLCRVQHGRGHETLWQPFDPRTTREPSIERNLYKNALGNRLIFEEVHHDLALCFRYRWSACDTWGWVRTASLENRGAKSIAVAFLDGLRNILPYGAPLTLHQTASTLVDAYKKTDLDAETGLGLFTLTSKIVDRPEAAEELRANTVWCHGLAEFRVSLAIESVDAFRFGDPVDAQRVLTGRRGNYFIQSRTELAPQSRVTWHLAADVGRSHGQIAALSKRLEHPADLGGALESDLSTARENLLQNICSADGIQLTGHSESSVHHLANVLFNNMRGGVFVHHHDVPRLDLMRFLRARNRDVAARHAPELHTLPEAVSVGRVQALARGTGDADFERLTYEYLPLHFSRRHGDPSRPWNRFSIHIKDDDGNRALRYEGNWRDIFQNWEALCHSFPEFLPGVIAKFVNASTVDGFNPYRVTHDGFEWEVADPNDPWSHIGYWGDHQIVYLLRLLEALSRFAPAQLHDLLGRSIFGYADVPYRLASYAEILRDPFNTITYDEELASQIESRVHATGMDGQLVCDASGQIYHVNLLEKLLVPALSKLSNFVPGAGIWMNTQRPEWNDANNALVGKGASVVTLCYLRRYLIFLARRLDGVQFDSLSVSTEVADWLHGVDSILRAARPASAARADAAERKRVLDALGNAFSTYREHVYGHGFSGKAELATDAVVNFTRIAIEHVDDTIRANRRDDNLYHAYNLLEFDENPSGVSSSTLDEMLEGQVAALSSGLLAGHESVELLTQLFESRLYRPDQRSFLLYPAHELPAFIDKNRVPASSIDAIPLLRELLEAGDRSIVERDALGVYRFHADFRNAEDVSAALDRLAGHERWTNAAHQYRPAVLDVFEAVFRHRRFTGRSSTMYGFEGVGCIYWHMVSKLLLAVQEVTVQAADDDEPALQSALAAFYDRIRDGLGFAKTPLEFGAFPTDAYSHTPAHAGAQQPGMTGQVKEGILARLGELGVRVEGGRASFRPRLLRRSEFRSTEGAYVFYDLGGRRRSIGVPAGSLAFSFCQVPIVYELVPGSTWIRVTERDGSTHIHEGDELDTRDSSALFARRGDIERLDVGVPKSLFQS